jgi:MerR family transcriptional regulator, light-induced transcriptional regulator
VGRGGQTVSATAFAQLTGVSRERLRTWERRHGFPAPVRVASGRRRYRLRDVPRVIAVRRASEEGVPIAAAIARTDYDDGADEMTAAALGAIVEHAPLPVAAISGPEPLAIAYANGALAALEPSVAMLAGTAVEAQLRALFASEDEDVTCEHPRWDGGEGSLRSVLFPLPVEAGRPPLVAMVGLDSKRERALAGELSAVEAELGELRERDARHVRWMEAIARLAAEFQVEASAGARDSALDTLVRQLNATDAALATYLSGQLAVASSRRGSLGPSMITVTAHPAVAQALRDAHAAWLEPAAASALGVPAGLHVCGIPVVVAGEPLGLVLMLFDEPEDISPDVHRMLTAVSAAVGFAMLRDRLAQELRDVAAQS